MLVCIFVNGAARLRERKIGIIGAVRPVSTLLVGVEGGRDVGGKGEGEEEEDEEGRDEV